jgi:hypothetical protein
MTTEERIGEVHSRLLGYGDFVNVGEASRLLDLGYQTVSSAIQAGRERSWYETRDSATKRNPRTGRPALEYRAVPRSD